MKPFKNILVSIFLIASLSFIMGHDIVLYYDHITNEIENTNNGAGSQRMSASESSSEEEVSFVSSDNVDHSINSGAESYAASGCLFPPLLYYSIWLPPDNS
jgi:hypothetical protein